MKIHHLFEKAFDWDGVAFNASGTLLHMVKLFENKHINVPQCDDKGNSVIIEKDSSLNNQLDNWGGTCCSDMEKKPGHHVLTPSTAHWLQSSLIKESSYSVS